METTPKQRRKPRASKSTATRRVSSRAKTEKEPKASAKSTLPSIKAAKAEEVAAEVQSTELTVVRRGAIIDDVVAQSGMRRSDVKDMLDATLRSLGEHLTDNSVLQLPPLGKIRVARVRETEGGKVVTCKVRMKDAALDAGKAGSLQPTRFSTAAE